MDVFADGAFEDFEDGFFGHGCGDYCDVILFFWAMSLWMFGHTQSALLEMSKY